MPTPRSIAARPAAALCAAAVLAGCRAGGSMSTERANDQLRARVLDLEGTVRSLEGRNAELAAKLAESERARSGALGREVLEAIPRCVSIGIGGWSGYQPAREGKPARVIVDIEPADALGRFVQIVGTLRVEARWLGAIGAASAEPVTLAAELGPAEVRDAYRAGVLSPRYTVAFDTGALRGPGDLVLRAVFLDALSGRELSATLTRRVGAEPVAGAGE